MVPFTILNIEELVDGRVRVEWDTIADDGLRLVEADTFTPDPTNDLEEEIAQWLESKRSKRAQINAAPKVRKPRPPAVKRSTARLSSAALDRIKTRVEEG